MARWFHKLAKNPSDMATFGAALADFESRAEEFRAFLKINQGVQIEMKSRDIAGQFEYMFGTLQDIESILDLYEREANVVYVGKKRGFLEHYNRVLSDKQAGEFAEVDSDVRAMRALVAEVANVRNIYVALSKGFETLHYQLTNITKLRVVGLDDATF